MSVLFFHFDGTGNEPADAFLSSDQDISISNVLKSHLLLGGTFDARGSVLPFSFARRSFYYPGIGTYGHFLARWLNVGFAFEDADVAAILRRALRDFNCHYDDQVSIIVLIGFSRGAALARRFAALINSFVPPGCVFEVVMDTVASIGWPNIFSSQKPTCEVVFEFGASLPVCVNRALHLVALDEQRLAFRPTLINQDGRVDEIWLSGVHSDVGGGYRSDGLADISFSLSSRWLARVLGIKQGQLHQPFSPVLFSHLAPDRVRLWQDALAIRPLITGRVHHFQRGSFVSSLTLAPRSCHVLRSNQPCLYSAPCWHQSVYLRMQHLPDYQPAAQVINDAQVWRQPTYE